MIDNATLRQLAELGGETFVTVYLPTHLAGRDTREDPIRLRNLLDEAERLAEQRGERVEDVRNLIEPARKLEDDDLFWRHQANGLCLVLGNGQILGADRMKVIKLASSPEPVVAISDRVHVRPLIPETSNAGKFYVLGVAMHRVVLLECFADRYREVDLYDVPKTIEDAVGYDYEQRSLQFHSGTAGHQGDRPAQFHGQGRAGGEDRDELDAFLHRVANGIDKILAGETRSPVVLAGASELVGKIRSALDHPRVVEGSLRGSVDAADLDKLHEEALAQLGPVFDEARQEAIETVKSAIGHGQGSVQLEALLSGAENARVGTLLADCSKPVWGHADGDGDELGIQTHSERTPTDDDLLDLVIGRAIRSGARVFSAAESELPGETAVAGEMRF